MNWSRFTEHQVAQIPKDPEAGVPVPNLRRHYRFTRSVFYKWKVKLRGMDTSELKRPKELETEKGKLKQMYTKLSLEH